MFVLSTEAAAAFDELTRTTVTLLKQQGAMPGRIHFAKGVSFRQSSIFRRNAFDTC